MWEYQYGWLDKVLQMTGGAEMIRSYSCRMDGQLASATQGGKTESFLWDGLALIARGETGYLNEPALTGGNPIAAGDQVLFNDLLGSTLGRAENGSYTPVAMTAFGETTDAGAFFTGKPAVGDLGYTFLLRNYRPALGKWQTSDPLGYPDGWNNFAYVNNSVTSAIDWLGGYSLSLNFTPSQAFVSEFSDYRVVSRGHGISASITFYIDQANGNVLIRWDKDAVLGDAFTVQKRPSGGESSNQPILSGTASSTYSYGVKKREEKFKDTDGKWYQYVTYEFTISTIVSVSNAGSLNKASTTLKRVKIEVEE